MTNMPGIALSDMPPLAPDTKLKKYSAAKISAVLIILACLFATYAPAIMVCYGFGDDYPELLDADGHGGKWIIHSNYGWGRIITGYLIEGGFKLAGSVDDMRRLRLMSLLEVATVAILIFRFAQAATGSTLKAAALSIFVCTLPPFLMAVSWATLCVITLPAILSLAAYRLAATPYPGGWRSPIARLRFLAVVAVLWVCFNIYQPTTGFFWFWFLLDTLTADRTAQQRWIRFARCLLIYCFSAGVYYLIFSAIGIKEPRSKLAIAIGPKITWFFTSVLPASFRLHWIETPIVFGAVILGTSMLIPLLISRERLLNRLTKLILSIAVLGLAYLPSLIVAETYATYRSRISIESVCGLLAIHAGWEIAGRLRGKVSLLASAAGIGLTTVAVVTAARTVLEYMVLPQAIEYRTMTNQLSRMNPSTCTSIELIPAALDARNFADPYYFEFRVPSTAFPPEWGIATTMMQAALDEVHPNWRESAKRPAIHVCTDGVVSHDPGAAIIDMRGTESLESRK